MLTLIQPLVNRLPGVVYVELELPSMIAKTNENFAELLGVSSLDIFTLEDGFDIIHPEDRDFTRHWMETELFMRPISEIRHRILHNGEVKHFHSVATTEFYEDGSPKFCRMFGMDVTKEIALEEEVNKLNISLELKTEAYRGVIHDLRSPIGNIKTILDLLELEQKLDDIPSDLELLAPLQASIEQAEKLITELRSLDSIEASSAHLKLCRVNVGEYFQNKLEGWEVLCRPKSIEITLQVEAEFSLLIDDLSFSRIFQNLIENAIKFSPEKSTIHLVISREEGIAILKVKDTGIGIPPELIPRLFDRNDRSKNRTGTKGEESTGLGLSITKQAVALHSGTIAINSEVGKGTEFEIRIPIR